MMTNLWKQRPPSFPNDDTIGFSAAELNQFNDVEDLTIEKTGRPESMEFSDSPVVKNKLSLRARDSIFVRREQSRSSVPQIFEDNNENYSENVAGAKGVRFSVAAPSSFGRDNLGFQPDNDVVLRRKSLSFKNTNDLDNYLVYHDIYDDRSSKSSTPEEKEPDPEWDKFKELIEEDADETLNSQWVEIFLKVFKLIAYFLTFFIILISAVTSKSIIFLMTSMTRINRTIPVCNDGIESLLAFKENRYKVLSVYDDPERIAWIWCLLFAMMAPELFTLFRSMRMCVFKHFKNPDASTFLMVLLMESMHTIGILMLVYLVLPTIDSTLGVILTNSLFLIPGLLLTFSEERSGKRLESMYTLVATAVQLIVLILWPIIVKLKDKDMDEEAKYFWAIPISFILISFGWWENFVSMKTNNKLIKWMSRFKEQLENSRYSTYLLVSIWKLILMFCGMIAIQSLLVDSNDRKDMVYKLFTKFGDAFTQHDLILVRDKGDLEEVIFEENKTMSSSAWTPIWTTVIQIAASLLCYVTSKFVCKICIQAFSFALPISLVIPTTVSLLIALTGIRSKDNCLLTNNFYPFQYMFFNNHFQIFSLNEWYYYCFIIIWIFTTMSQTWISAHIWTSSSERLASTEKIFITPFYSSVIIDQSVAFNRRREVYEEKNKEIDKQNDMEKGNDNEYYTNQENDNMGYKPDKSTAVTRIYACATMWHESADETLQMLKSIMRMDEDQSARVQAQQWFSINSKQAEYYEYETHIFFDDAFEQGKSDAEDDRLVNQFVKQFVEVMDKAATSVHQTTIELKSPKKVPTPYGGRLEWTLPGQTKLIAHLKDKTKIRHRKRWSQVMYMYYLLGLKIANLPIDDWSKKMMADKTFILALDGDINFRPSAVHLLVDLMTKNSKLGAACGRIHPVGSGPMAWYQLFEYAISHWLQKATEHVFGCVLCSPGCFSLFRATALMDDNVMRRYTTKPTEALHYVQYDQGEDRWLCTLMLQQGWRVEYSAASDAYTHCPEGFGEFYIQRRRWAPSTMANIMDLLRDYKHTVEVNENISFLYILYQAGLMIGTILSPGTIFLMLVGAMNTAFGVAGMTSFYINAAPVIFFILMCFFAKNEWQILTAQMLSTLYAMLMLAVLVSTALEINQESALSPSAFFFISMISIFVFAAIIHPQEFLCLFPSVIYLLTIPSMYLLLTLYSIINLNIVTWGTREVKSKLTAKEKAEEELIAREAAERAKAGSGLRKWLPIGDFGKGSNWGFSCVCCSAPKDEEGKVHFNDIKNMLNTFNSNMTELRTTVENIKPSNLRRGSSFRKAMRFGENTVITENTQSYENPVSDSESHDNDSEDDESKPMINEEEKNIPYVELGSKSEPIWIKDEGLKNGPIVQLKEAEETFWVKFIAKYLYPLDEDRAHQARVAAELIDLRNKAVFAFGIINVLFILFVFLLQMHKDVFHIDWPIGLNHNMTYNDNYDTYEDVTTVKNVQMDPIGLVLVLFFGAILLTQFFGMLLHRFGTIAHLLAFVELDCFTKNAEDFSDENQINNNAVQIARKLQKLKGIENLENKYGDYASSNDNRLDVAFRKRFMSLRPDSIENDFKDSNLKGLKRKSAVAALVQRRNTIIENRRKSLAPFVAFDHTIQSSPSPEQHRDIDKQIVTSGGSPSSSKSSTSRRSSPNFYGQETPEPIRRFEPIEDRPVTGQHNIADYNFQNNDNLSGMSEGLSADIIRKSLNAFVNTNPDSDRTDHSPEDNNVHQIEAQVHSTDSSTASSVSSNIDFNFEPFEDDLSNNENDFPLMTFQPTRVHQLDSNEGHALPWNIPIGHTQEDSNKFSTRF